MEVDSGPRGFLNGRLLCRGLLGGGLLGSGFSLGGGHDYDLNIYISTSDLRAAVKF